MKSLIIAVALTSSIVAQSSSGGAGQPQTVSIVDLVERELISGKEPRRETLIACSSHTRTTLLQLNQDQPERQYDTAEISYYVVAGEGTVRIAGRDTAVAASSLVALPRGIPHGMTRRGKRPLILIVTLSGAPCEQTL
jgi:mannose-6-phosphate isomerase-like protein (cupin superfamily)